MQLQCPDTVSPSAFSKIPRSGSISGPHMRRRVNPDSLASRLGPELIKELESLLVPGSTEMPPFSARQAIQKRYNIDRRHIYDWYHTKGLRVSSKESTDRGERANIDSKELRPRLKRKLQPASDILDDPTGTAAAKTYPSDEGPSYYTSSSTPSTPLDPNGGFLGYETGSHLTGFPLQYFFDSPSYRNPQVTSIAFSHPQTPYSDLPTVSTPPDFLIGHPDLAHRQPCYSSYHEQPLPQAQREAYYRCLADALGPACGVQESVGTYRAFMTQQVHTYFERLVPTGIPGRTSAAPIPSRTRAPTPVSVSVSTKSPSVGYVTRTPPSFSSQLHTPNPDCASSSATPDPPTPLLSRHAKGVTVASSPASTPLSTPISAESTGGGGEFVWPWDSSQTDGAEHVLDIAELLKSPLLRSRTSSWENDTPESSALPTPDLQDSTNTEPTTVSSDYVFENHSWGQTSPSMAVISEPRTFSVSLRTAKEPLGLEKTVTITASRDKNRDRKSRPRRSTSNSAGGGI